MIPIRFLFTITGLSLTLACARTDSDLEQHTEACQQTCADAQSECASDPAFADPWALSCEVACNLEFDDAAAPVQSCLDAAGSCAQIDQCLGPSVGGTGVGPDTGPTPPPGPTPTDTTDGGDDTTGGPVDPPDAGDDSSSGGPTFEGPECCDISGAPCTDAQVLECACVHMPQCCVSGGWDEACASVADANGCIDAGCPAFEGWVEYSCTCNTIDVFCPEDPFVSQLIFGTDACGSTEAEALATAMAACEQGSDSCEVGKGSCACSCNDFGDACGPTRPR